MSPFKPFRQFLLHAAAALAVLGTVGALGGVTVMYFGLYNIAAVDQHTLPVYTLLDTALRQAIRQRARPISEPSLSDPDMVRKGFIRFRNHCVPCHGAPGIPPGDAGKGMLPLPNNLVESARELAPREIFWVIKNGIKMTGMPAWQYRFNDEEIWSIVAFVTRLPGISPQDYRALEGEQFEQSPTRAER
jgi:mono/diheme cytochrome c family protein